jgi:copper chaperone CopZ
MSTTRLKIAKLSGAADVEHIEKALEAVPRVASVRVDLSENQAVVEHDGADPNELQRAVKEVGYLATID